MGPYLLFPFRPLIKLFQFLSLFLPRYLVKHGGVNTSRAIKYHIVIEIFTRKTINELVIGLHTIHWNIDLQDL